MSDRLPADGWKLFAACAVTAFLVVCFFFYRSYITSKNDRKLCQVLVAYVGANADPTKLRRGDYGWTYAHRIAPQEAARAHAHARETTRKFAAFLDCNHL